MTDPSGVRVLLLADTHLGLDLPVRPRVKRRRRGPDFFANMERALRPALAGEVDLVVHGGDLLYRSRVPPELVQDAMAPLFRVADLGVPVFLVPGNHERSQIPYPLLARHPRVFIFDRPHTFEWRHRGVRIAVGGWPYHGAMAGVGFAQKVRACGVMSSPAELRLLCLHQIVQGARVGIQDYQFREGRDVIAAEAIPDGLAAVLSGHIHRHQVLTHDLEGQHLAAPVLYPGAVERTSFAERDEPKGFMRLELAPASRPGGELLSWTFEELPTRPMVEVDLTHHQLRERGLERLLRRRLQGLDPDAIVRVRCQVPGGRRSPIDWDRLPRTARSVLGAASLRALAPPTMNVSAGGWGRA